MNDRKLNPAVIPHCAQVRRVKVCALSRRHHSCLSLGTAELIGDLCGGVDVTSIAAPPMGMLSGVGIQRESHVSRPAARPPGPGETTASCFTCLALFQKAWFLQGLSVDVPTKHFDRRMRVRPTSAIQLCSQLFNCN